MKAAAIDLSNERTRLDDLAPSLAAKAGVVGAGGLLLALVLSFFGAESFFRGYLVNYAFFLSLALGAVFFVLLQHATRAGWSVAVRRIAEALMNNFALLAVLALPVVIPLLIGWPHAIKEVYRWANAELVAGDPVLTHKSPYFARGFFLLRLALYFGLWIVISRFYYNASVEQDRTGDPALTSRMQWWAPLSLILYALTETYASFDLLMSLDAHWFSTMFGVYFYAGSALAAFAMIAVLMNLLQQSGRLTNALTPDHFHDVGKLVFAWTIFWAYIAYSQYMLIWYANLPEETGWFYARQQGGWLYLSLLLLFGHFVVPFLALISRLPKRRKDLLLIGAAWMLLMHWFDMFYVVMPHFERVVENGVHAIDEHGRPVIHVNALSALDVVQSILCLLGIGGLFAWSVIRRLGQAALIPERDPRLNESLAFENY